jgi:uncharacterized protein
MIACGNRNCVLACANEFKFLAAPPNLSILRAMPSEQFVRDHFALWEKGDETFGNHVDDNASFKMTGHGTPLCGTYTPKREFFGKYPALLAQRLSTKVSRKITNVIAMGDYAIVEFVSSGSGKLRGHYEVEVVWICKYNGDKLIEVTAYMDSAIVKQGFDENE